MNHLTRVGARPGLRVSLRTADRDVVGLVTDLDEQRLTLRLRDGRSESFDRSAVSAARVVPLVSRGRNPHHFDPEQVRRLAHDPAVGGTGEVWVGRLCELVSSLDAEGVEVVDGVACRGGSAARAFGEWATIRLASPDDLPALGAWAALQDARNAAVTSDLSDRQLTELGLARLQH